jgi:hypothetical protein
MFLIIGLAASSHRLCVSMHQVVNSQHTVCRQGQPKGIVAIIVGSEEEKSILYTTQQHPIGALYSLRERLDESSVICKLFERALARDEQFGLLGEWSEDIDCVRPLYFSCFSANKRTTKTGDR